MKQFRKLLLQRLIVSLLNIPIFYYLFWIFYDVASNVPLQLIIMGNLFNVLMVLLLFSLQTVLWLAIDSPEFRQWLLTLEREARSGSASRVGKASSTQKKRKKELFF